jgi:hypothetical protein
MRDQCSVRCFFSKSDFTISNLFFILNSVHAWPIPLVTIFRGDHAGQR